MRSLRAVFVLLALVVAFAALAHEVPMGVIASSGSSTTNLSTAAPFKLNSNTIYAVQCDAAACVRAGAGSTTTVTCTKGSSNTGVKVAADTLYDLPLKYLGTNEVDTIAIIPVSGSASCQVFRVDTL
jgi:hypothetical protein